MAQILVAEDEEGVRSFLVETLELDGHDVVEAVDGQEALDLLRARVFDVLLTDLTMPRLGGMALLEHVRKEQPELEVVVLTAHGTVSVAVEAMREGAYDFLQKPLSSPAALRLTISRAVERHRLRCRAETEGKRTPALTYGAPAMVAVVDQLARVAGTDATVLLVGETGTGKEVMARALHQRSKRAGHAFVAVNCASLSEELVASELFGHEKGAFTGAHARQRGKLELAQGGTVFLDELGELSPALQARLLRALEERTFERVGGTTTIRADVRWVAATNRDLPAMIETGAFREDLFHRLAVFPIRLPPLRERQADIVPIARELLAGICREMGRPPLALSPAAEAELTAASWPGNVRQLRNALERATILTESDSVELTGIAPDPLRQRAPSTASTAPHTLVDLEREAIEKALAATDGNRKQAAERLGIGVRTLYEKLKRYGMT